MSVSCSGAGKRVNRKALQQSARLAVEGLEIRMLLSAGGGFTAAGITGDYYNSTDLSGPVAFERQDVRVDFDWGAAAAPGGSTAPNFASIGHNNFSARWSGQLVPAFSQTYTFKTISDDGVRLYLRPAGTTSWTTVIDDWTSHTAKTDTAAYALTAGVTYDVRMEYYQTTGAALAELHWSSPTKPEEPIEAASDVGVNMTAYAQTTYADAMKVGRTYWEGGTPQDANGWPTTDATNIPWEGADPASVAGTYLLSFTGTAQVTAQPFGPANFVVNGTSYGSVLPKGVGYNSTTNTTTASLTLTSSNAGLFRLSFDNSQRTAAGATNTGVTNVQLMRPTSPGASTSYPLGTVFTDYAKTAMSRITTERWLTADFNLNDVNWSDRTLPSYFKADFGASGQIWEYLVMFSNETGKDLYITVPTTASDSYLTNLADLIKYGSDGVNAYTAPQANPVYPGLNSNLRVYVEWGNETWNVDFPQGVQGREAAAGAVASNSPEGQIENYDGQAGGGDYRRWNALKTLDTSNDFRSVWGDSAMGDRVRILMTYQYYNLNLTATTALSFLNNYFNNGDGQQHVATPHPVSYYIWGAGAAAYFGLANGSGAQSSILVSDPSFETPAVAAGTAMVDPTSLDWTFTGNAGIYHAPSTAGATIGNLGAPPNPPDGSQAAFIGDTSSIQTTINFTQTGTFAINLTGANKPGGENGVRIFLDGNEITPNGGWYQPTSNPWVIGSGIAGVDDHNYNFQSTAPFTISTTGNHVLKIVGTGASGTYAFLDTITVGSLDAMFAGGTDAVGPGYEDQLNVEAKYPLEYGLHPIFYEGGWAANGSPLQNYAKYVDPRAATATVNSINAVAEAGGQLYMMGTWDLWPVSDQPNASKYPIAQGIDTANKSLLPGLTSPQPFIFTVPTEPAPAQQNVSNSGIAAAGGAELGMKFTSDQSGYITGVRFWKGTQNTGPHTGELWSSTGQLLATATFSNETSGGWQQVYFSSPVAITANTTYVVSYHTTSSKIADTPGGLSAAINTGPLHALPVGVFADDATPGVGSFPNQPDAQSANYWVDVTFSPVVPYTPSQPFNFGAYVNNATSVGIYWGDGFGEVTAYHIERSTDGIHFTEIAGNISGTFGYTDNSVQSGTTYYYRMRSENAGSYSVYTNVVQLTTPGPTPPATPANFNANPSTTGIALTWSANSESDLAGYNVYRSSSSAGPYTILNSSLLTTTSYNDSAAPTGVVSYYEVVAVDTSNLSSPPAYASATRPSTSGTATTIFDPAAAPAANLQNIYDPGIVNAGGVELGMKFTSDVSGSVSGVRFYKGSQETGTQTGELWSSTGQLLATATFTSETASGWQQISFSQPVAISANTTYVVSYHTTSGTIAYTSGVFASGIDNGPLHAPSSSSSGGNDVYAYGASAFPTAYNGQSANYWVDVVFAAGTVPPVPPPPVPPPPPPPPPASVTLFAGSSAPASGQQNIYDQGILNAGGVELGMKFTSDTAGTVSGVRFYKGSQGTGTQTGELWSSTGQLLATATFTSETASGWQQVNFSQPVAINSNTTYIVSYHTTSGAIAYTSGVFASGIDNAPLHAPASSSSGGNDVYAYGASAFPTVYNGQSPNYWVDAVFAAGTTPPVPPPPVPPPTTPPPPVTLFAASSAPASGQQNIFDQGILNAGGVELGMKFTSDVAGTVSGVRFYKGSQETGAQTGELWSSTGQLLATATFTSETASGWQQVNFSSPVSIAASTTYIVSYHTTSGTIAYTFGAMTSGVDNAPLHAPASSTSGGNDVYVYGASALPTVYNGQAANYWVDAVFNPS